MQESNNAGEEQGDSLSSLRSVQMSSKPRPISDYKPLPTDWKKSEHYYFYGWAVTDDILRDHLIKHNLPVPKGAIFIDGNAIFDMEQRSRYFHICCVQGKPDDEAAKQGRVVQTDSGPQLMLLAISCTRSKRLFQRRPRKKQLDILVKLLGEEPRWFEDFKTKENFVDSFMD